MLNALIPVLAFVPFFLFLVFYGLRQKSCPDCQATLSGFQSPFEKTRRQWVEGGYRCHNCGCETDMAGAKMTENASMSPGTN